MNSAKSLKILKVKIIYFFKSSHETAPNPFPCNCPRIGLAKLLSLPSRACAFAEPQSHSSLPSMIDACVGHFKFTNKGSLTTKMSKRADIVPWNSPTEEIDVGMANRWRWDWLKRACDGETYCTKTTFLLKDMSFLGVEIA